MKSQYNSGFAVAIAWPETLCKQASAWYDLPVYVYGINKRGGYKVGHAAVVLIENKTGNCFYFDFGRYHAPHGFGRVRDKETDHDLEIKTTALILENQVIQNLEEILGELSLNESCHGTGKMHAAFTTIDFSSSFEYAKRMQQQDFYAYGPFVNKGTNCSRFVQSVILAGLPIGLKRVKLKFPLTITASPKGNVKALNKKPF